MGTKPVLRYKMIPQKMISQIIIYEFQLQDVTILWWSVHDAKITILIQINLFYKETNANFQLKDIKHTIIPCKLKGKEQYTLAFSGYVLSTSKKLKIFYHKSHIIQFGYCNKKWKVKCHVILPRRIY